MSKINDLTGQKFGRLTVIKRDESSPKGRSKWICQCDCGNTISVLRNHLTCGTTKSCGCIKKYVNLKAIKSGTQFGQLEVIERTEQKSGNSYIYKCKCTCGNICFVSSAHLKNGNTKSCGCFSATEHKKAIKKAIEIRGNFYVDGTDIVNIVPGNPRYNNTSGCKGVSWDRSVNLWKAYITFKGKRYYLGSSSDFNYAVSLRKAAEGEIYGDFLEWYASEHPEQWEKLMRKKKND